MEDKQSGRSIMFYEICRLCLDDRGSSSISDSNDIINKIFQCTGIKVSPTDNLPQEICLSCLDIVNKAAQLRSTAYKNDQYLKNLFEDDTESQKTINKESNTSKDKTKKKDTEAPQDHNVNSFSSVIKVRKDLFETSMNEVSSPTTEKQETRHKSKKRKQDCNSSVESECIVSSQSKDENASSLRVKKREKDGITEYECMICSKVYESWKKVYLHFRSHNKTIACPLDACGKKFATKGDLERHIRAHTGEKPYKCDTCDKSFTQSGTLKQHKLNVHNVVFP